MKFSRWPLTSELPHLVQHEANAESHFSWDSQLQGQKNVGLWILTPGQKWSPALGLAVW